MCPKSERFTQITTPTDILTIFGSRPHLVVPLTKSLARLLTPLTRLGCAARPSSSSWGATPRPPRPLRVRPMAHHNHAKMRATWPLWLLVCSPSRKRRKPACTPTRATHGATMSISSGIITSSLAGAATGVGALGVYFVRKLTERVEDALLSTAAGIMLAASFFSLILPGIARGEALGYSRAAAVAVVIAGLLAGASLIWLLNHYMPHEHFVQGRQGPNARRISRVWLFVITITLHNFPEGMAVGVGAATTPGTAGLSLAAGIGLQNIPEGLAVAAALLTVGYSRTRAMLISLATGLVEGIGGALGAMAGLFAQPFMPWALGSAAGAMLYIISDEVIPETHSRKHQTLATFSLLGGFCVMMFLDATLG